MAENDFTAFAIGAGANVLSPSAWAADGSIAQGFLAGEAYSQKCNTAWRQASFVAAALGQLINDSTGLNALDDGVIAHLEASMQALLLGQPEYAGVDTGAANVYVGALAPAYIAASYPDGMTVRFQVGAGHTNTGNSTFNCGTPGAKPILYQDGTQIGKGTLNAGGTFTLTYSAAASAWLMQALSRSPVANIWYASTQVRVTTNSSGWTNLANSIAVTKKRATNIIYWEAFASFLNDTTSSPGGTKAGLQLTYNTGGGPTVLDQEVDVGLTGVLSTISVLDVASIMTLDNGSLPQSYTLQPQFSSPSSTLTGMATSAVRGIEVWN